MCHNIEQKATLCWRIGVGRLYIIIYRSKSHIDQSPSIWPWRAGLMRYTLHIKCVWVKRTSWYLSLDPGHFFSFRSLNHCPINIRRSHSD
jgi:hypothetical protein